ncbi:HSP20-like chaperone [Arabidopsis thaliana x Arabidopsis arenosa]|uniref:Co-chaperone protein p23 n=1 Tax=Arabidopsis thaliana x Arabidopsis arenosa TaxID=1240361 RepID=A0A8T2C7C1_9BRAS|nr:HSP20-like chaperone [Arabidopsis thaliana x Arabidopsis arenosa]
MSRHPTVKWAQRSDKVYITVELPDAEDVKLKLEPQGKFFFSATSGASKTPYEVDLDLFDSVDVNESKASVSSRCICYMVKKAESKWWDRLIKQEGKPPVFLKVDWDKWVDEDEDKGGGADMDFGDFDFTSLNMGDSEGIRDEEDGSDMEEEIMAESKEAENIVEEGDGEKDEAASDVKKD